MKNTDIKYKNLSKDYVKLYDLLHKEIIVIAFIGLTVNNVIRKEHSKITQLSYNKTYKSYDFGVTVFFESDFNQEGFIAICEEYNIQFFDLNI